MAPSNCRNGETQLTCFFTNEKCYRYSYVIHIIFHFLYYIHLSSIMTRIYLFSLSFCLYVKWGEKFLCIWDMQKTKTFQIKKCSSSSINVFMIGCHRRLNSGINMFKNVTYHADKIINDFFKNSLTGTSGQVLYIGAWNYDKLLPLAI